MAVIPKKKSIAKAKKIIFYKDIEKHKPEVEKMLLTEWKFDVELDVAKKGARGVTWRGSSVNISA